VGILQDADSKGNAMTPADWRTACQRTGILQCGGGIRLKADGPLFRCEHGNFVEPHVLGLPEVADAATLWALYRWLTRQYTVTLDPLDESHTANYCCRVEVPDASFEPPELLAQKFGETQGDALVAAICQLPERE